MKPSSNVKVIPQEKLHVSEPNPVYFGNGPNKKDPSWTNENWLKSRFHFNFAEYYSSKNPSFGVLRVMNDDLVQPHRGFGTHPHANMEIITYIVHGSLTHQDSIGTASETLGRGSIQFMTAGTGVQHSETNNGDKPLRFVQTWITPSKYRLKPNYGSFRGSPDQPKNEWRHLVASVDDQTETPVKINQNVDGYAAEIEQDQSITHVLEKGEQAYLLCIEGEVSVNGHALKKYDACEIVGTGEEVLVQATNVEDTEHGKLAHVLMFTMEYEPGSGRTDI